jgi:hypothetical protein
MLLVVAGGATVAQSPSPEIAPAGPLCLLGLDELNQLTGLQFVSTASGETNCTYESDLALDTFMIDLRIEDADLSIPDDGLALIRMVFDDGRETSVGGFPAWESAHGMWTDLGGGDVFVVQPILFFTADPPDPASFLAPVAQLAVSRLRPDAVASEAPG